MAKQYDFVEEATGAMIALLQEWQAEGRAPLLPHGYDAGDPEGMVARINDTVFPISEVTDQTAESWSCTSRTIIMDVADWRTVCAECGISYHEAPKPEGEPMVPVSVLRHLLEVIIACGDEAVQSRNNTPQNIISEMRQQSYHDGRATAYSACQALLANLLEDAP